MENCESVLRSFVGEECSLGLHGIPHPQCNYYAATGLVCFDYYVPVVMYMKKPINEKKQEHLLRMNIPLPNRRFLEPS